MGLMTAQHTRTEGRDRENNHDPRWLFWLLLTAGLMGFIALARLKTYQTMTARGRGYVWEQWWRLRNDLPDVGWPGVMSATYFLMLVVVAGGSLMALWLALHAGGTDEPEGVVGAPSTDNRLVHHQAASPIDE
jgi:hypothetical protein